MNEDYYRRWPSFRLELEPLVQWRTSASHAGDPKIPATLAKKTFKTWALNSALAMCSPPCYLKRYPASGETEAHFRVHRIEEPRDEDNGTPRPLVLFPDMRRIVRKPALAYKDTRIGDPQQRRLRAVTVPDGAAPHRYVPVRAYGSGPQMVLDFTAGPSGDPAADDWYLALALLPNWRPKGISRYRELYFEARAGNSCENFDDPVSQEVSLNLRFEDNAQVSRTPSRHQQSSVRVLPINSGPTKHTIPLQEFQWGPEAFDDNTSPVNKDAVLQVTITPIKPDRFRGCVEITRIELR